MAEYKTELNLSDGEGNYFTLNFITQDNNVLLSQKSASYFTGTTVADALNEIKAGIDKFNEGI